MPNYPKFMSMFYAAELNGKYMCFTETAGLPTFGSLALFNPAPSVQSLAKRSAGLGKGMIAAESLIDKLP